MSDIENLHTATEDMKPLYFQFMRFLRPRLHIELLKDNLVILQGNKKLVVPYDSIEKEFAWGKAHCFGLYLVIRLHERRRYLLIYRPVMTLSLDLDILHDSLAAELDDHRSTRAFTNAPYEFMNPLPILF